VRDGQLTHTALDEMLGKHRLISARIQQLH
jgi:hypothetical protein